MKKTMILMMNMLAMIVSMVAGGGVMMAGVTVGAHGSDTDPNDNKPLDNATPDETGKGIDQHGQGTTASAMADADLVENKINDYVSKFQAYDYPMHTDFLREARQIKVDTKEPEDYAIGEAVMEANLKTAVDGTSYPATVALGLYGNDKAIFPAGSTILVQDGGSACKGYAEDASGQWVADGLPLVLYVDSNANGTVTVSPINGPKNSGTMYIPSITAGAKLYVMAPALSESEVEITPDSAFPQAQKCYLQKKVCAITYTDLFARIKKKAAWNVQDIKDWQLSMFRKKCTRSLLISAPSKFLKDGGKNVGMEYCYTQNGVLRQLRLGYQVGEKIEFNDLIAMQRMVFSKFTNGVKEVDVYCGTKKLEQLHSIDFSKHPEVQLVRQTMGETKITVSSFESTFGKFNFKKEQALDDLGLSDYMVVFSMGKAKRFFYENGKTINVDHSKGEGGEVREAKSQYYIQDDCLRITDMNSMLVGPNVTLVGKSYGSAKKTVIGVDALPGDAAAAGYPTGTVVYLRTPDTTAHKGVGLYVSVVTTASGSTTITWNEYNGEIDV